MQMPPSRPITSVEMKMDHDMMQGHKQKMLEQMVRQDQMSMESIPTK